LNILTLKKNYKFYDLFNFSIKKIYYIIYKMGEVGCLKDESFQNLEVQGNLRVNGVEHKWVVGYAPSTFVGLAQNDVKNFNTSPGMGEKTTAATGALTLPMGALLLSAFVINPTANAITTVSTFDIGVNVTSATLNDNIFDGVATATVNAGGQVWGGRTSNDGSEDIVFCGLGHDAATLHAQTIATRKSSTDNIGSVFTSGSENFVTFKVLGGACAGPGADMRIYIEYINFEEKL
jgi:hypothetical protein